MRAAPRATVHALRVGVPLPRALPALTGRRSSVASRPSASRWRSSPSMARCAGRRRRRSRPSRARRAGTSSDPRRKVRRALDAFGSAGSTASDVPSSRSEPRFHARALGAVRRRRDRPRRSRPRATGWRPRVTGFLPAAIAFMLQVPARSRWTHRFLFALLLRSPSSTSERRWHWCGRRLRARRARTSERAASSAARAPLAPRAGLDLPPPSLAAAPLAEVGAVIGGGSGAGFRAPARRNLFPAFGVTLHFGLALRPRPVAARSPDDRRARPLPPARSNRSRRSCEQTGTADRHIDQGFDVARSASPERQ